MLRIEDYRAKVNPCYGCGCWDEDMGCTMPAVDKCYACSLEDERELEFFMAMDPPTVTHQEKQVHVVKGKPIFYEPEELKKARVKLMAYLAKYVPGTPYTSGIELVTKWCFPRGRHSDGEYRITKPDTDNLQKLLKDCMTALKFWTDDALVAREITEKFWAEVPGIYIRIREL